MKKEGRTFTLRVFCAFTACMTALSGICAENFELKSHGKYLYFSESAVETITLSNTNAVRAFITTTLEDANRQILVETLNPGISSMEIQTKTGKKNLVLTVKNSALKINPESSFYEIDMPFKTVK